jgi:hypothetical protein
VTPPPTWLYFPAAAAAPWVPSDVSGLLAWYKADSISQSDDTNVTSWANSQGTSGRDLVDAGTAPKFRTNVQNSLPVVRFGGSGNLVCSSASWLPNLKSPMTCACVGKLANTTEHHFVTFMPVTGTPAVRFDVLRVSSFMRTFMRDAGSTFRFADGPASGISAGYRIAVSQINSSVQPTHRFDGTQASLTFGGAYSSYAALTDASPDSLIVGAIWTTNYATRLPNTAEIAEIVIYDSALSTADAERLEGYLAHKWGLTGNLPGGHPHKTTPP